MCRPYRNRTALFVPAGASYMVIIVRTTLTMANKPWKVIDNHPVILYIVKQTAVVLEYGKASAAERTAKALPHSGQQLRQNATPAEQ